MRKELQIVSPSVRIMEELNEMSLAQRIEACGRVCYKSEGKITPDSANGFARAMVRHKHNSTLELSPVTARVEFREDFHFRRLLEIIPKYLFIDYIEKSDSNFVILVSGSIRAFRELVMLNPSCSIGWAIAENLRSSCFFDDIDFPDHEFPTGVSAEKLSLAEVDQLSDYLHSNHRYVAAKFVVSRAVSHEIVRHRPCALLQESQRYCRYSKDQFGGRVTFIKPMFFEEGSEEYQLWREVMLYTEERYLKLLKTKSPQAARTVLPNSCKTEVILCTNLAHWEHIFHLRCSDAAEPSMREVMIPLRGEFQKMFPQHSFDRRMPEGWIK